MSRTERIVWVGGRDGKTDLATLDVASGKVKVHVWEMEKATADEVVAALTEARDALKALRQGEGHDN